MDGISQPQEYRPLLIPRRGEMIAWVSTILVVVIAVVLSLQNEAVGWLLWLLGVLLLFSALLISLSNWVDRRTIIRIQPDGIEYQNGLRHISLGWEQVQGLRVQPNQWGKRVQVIGDGTSFTFRTLGEVRMRGKLQGRMGFAQGDEILRQVVSNSGLRVTGREDGERYYSRI
jgi:hypothetical protein